MEDTDIINLILQIVAAGPEALILFLIMDARNFNLKTRVSSPSQTESAIEEAQRVAALPMENKPLYNEWVMAQITGSTRLSYCQWVVEEEWARQKINAEYGGKVPACGIRS